MKLGVSSYSFEKYRKQTGCDFAELCRLAKEIGFDAIEFSGAMDAPDPIKRAKELRALCADLGLEIASYTITANFGNEDREGEVKKLFALVDVAEALGVKVMRHDVCWSLPEGKTWYEMVPIIAPYIRRVTEYAKSKGIRTCSENHGQLFQDSERMETLINAVGDKNYGWLVDIGNFMCVDEWPLSAVRRAAKYAVHVHVKDFLYHRVTENDLVPEGYFGTRNGNLLRGTVVGHGAVPVKDCLTVLHKAGYNGTVSIEFEGYEDNIPALKMGYAFMRRVLESVENA